MFKESINNNSKAETKVYDLEEDIVVVPRTNPTMAIERTLDYEAEELIKSLDSELLSCSEFTDKRKLFINISRKANELRAARPLQRFLYYSLLRELQQSENRLEKSFLVSMVRENINRVKMDGDFKVAYIQSLVLMFELERVPDIGVALLELISYLCKDCNLDAEVRYDIISTMHPRLFHPDFRMKKNSLSIIISLTKIVEQDFLVVVENVLERCVETQNKDLILVFVQALADLEFVVCSTKISKLVSDIVANPIFSFNREALLHLLTFLEHLVATSLSTELSRNVYLFLCKNMRNLHKDVRKKATDVFCKLDLRSVSEDLLMASIQKEKFEDYQSKKKAGDRADRDPKSFLAGDRNGGNGSLSSSVAAIVGAGTGSAPLMQGRVPADLQQLKKLKGIESNTERTVSTLEMKSANDNVVIGCIHHVLEDELPEVRIAAIKALEALGKILTVEKNQDIKEMLLYFLNDDFDKVRIKALQSLGSLFSDISLSDFELDTIQFNMRENVYELRVSIYKLMCNFNSKKYSQLVRLVERLLENIKIYREDAPIIYKTVKKVFEKNKRYHVEIVNELIFSDKVNIIQEKDWRDSESIVRIILMSNALRFNQQLIERYPHYYKKQVILLKDVYPSLVYDMDNEDSNAVISMKHSIIGEETIRSFLKCLNEQVRGRENLKLAKTLKYNFESGVGCNLGSHTIEMFWFCDKLIRKIKKAKLEINSILPDKRKIVDTILRIAHTRHSLRVSPNLKKYLALCELFFWTQYLYCKLKSAQLKRKIDQTRFMNIINSLYDSALILSKEDNTGQYSKIAQFLQPLLHNVSHSMLLTNTNLLSIFTTFMSEYSIQEFGFYSEDFTNIMQDKAFLHSKDNEDEIIEVMPRYPFNFKLYAEAESSTATQSFIVLKEFDETTTLVQLNTKNSITTSEDKLSKVLVDMHYDVRRRIDGVLDLKISMMKFMDFRTLGQTKLKGWLSIFKHAKSTIPTFPFVLVSNEVTLKLRTKY